ncbi:5-formyltetrahydrofolate cyclo-ligase [Mesobacillus persicus]|uniref:5-formyltetrahydrofolate cyclo-ligase n=1 Tax=Mesobacillus persicus TaxID=930146 RepID=A0A1H7X4Q5_9BACI|nr:5-formyltetrahydrofolate cyclo-ligase [Mesobacillus persicus]SEM28564.1 5-formyltetrahydrofolate cyclo-ligase [Mesobacillus persicus]
MRKKTLRNSMKSELEKLSLPVYEDLSYQIARRLFDDSSWKDADVIGMTISKAPEVDTFQLIRKAWEQGKTVVIPKCVPHTKEMVFRTLTRFSELEKVYFGLYEPIPSETAEINAENIDLLVVPGLAYTTAGYRLGFGGGYYDRYLKKYHNQTLSLAFSQQIVSDLPNEPHDMAVAKIVTEEGVFLCGG